MDLFLTDIWYRRQKALTANHVGLSRLVGQQTERAGDMGDGHRKFTNLFNSNTNSLAPSFPQTGIQSSLLGTSASCFSYKKRCSLCSSCICHRASPSWSNTCPWRIGVWPWIFLRTQPLLRIEWNRPFIIPSVSKSPSANGPATWDTFRYVQGLVVV